MPTITTTSTASQLVGSTPASVLQCGAFRQLEFGDVGDVAELRHVEDLLTLTQQLSTAA